MDGKFTPGAKRDGGTNGNALLADRRLGLALDGVMVVSANCTARHHGASGGDDGQKGDEEGAEKELHDIYEYI